MSFCKRCTLCELLLYGALLLLLFVVWSVNCSLVVGLRAVDGLFFFPDLLTAFFPCRSHSLCTRCMANSATIYVTPGTRMPSVCAADCDAAFAMCATVPVANAPWTNVSAALSITQVRAPTCLRALKRAYSICFLCVCARACVPVRTRAEKQVFGTKEAFCGRFATVNGTCFSLSGIKNLLTMVARNATWLYSLTAAAGFENVAFVDSSWLVRRRRILCCVLIVVFSSLPPQSGRAPLGFDTATGNAPFNTVLQSPVS